MKRLIIGFSIVTCAVAVAAQGRPTEPEIIAAIKCAMKETKCDKPIMGPSFGASLADLNYEIAGPLGRVYVAAADAKSKYKSFAIADVSPEMLAETVVFRARWESEKMTRNSPVDHIVVLPKGKKDGAVQPMTITDWTYDAHNLMGATATRVGKEAVFRFADLPPGDFDFVVISPGIRDYRVSIDAKARTRLGLPQ